MWGGNVTGAGPISCADHDGARTLKNADSAREVAVSGHSMLAVLSETEWRGRNVVVADNDLAGKKYFEALGRVAPMNPEKVRAARGY